MTYNQAAKIVSQISYKPGWKFIVFSDHDLPVREICVEIQFETEDSRPGYRGETSSVNNRRKYWLADLEERVFIDMIRSAIQEIEIHESHEWLRYQGNLLTDPHGEDVVGLA